MPAPPAAPPRPFLFQSGHAAWNPGAAGQKPEPLSVVHEHVAATRRLKAARVSPGPRAATRSGYLGCGSFRTDSGQPWWSFKTGESGDCGANRFRQRDDPAPALFGETIFVPGLDGVFYALNATSRQIRGTYPLNATHRTPPNISGATAYAGADDRIIAIPVADILNPPKA